MLCVCLGVNLPVKQKGTSGDLGSQPPGPAGVSATTGLGLQAYSVTTPGLKVSAEL